MLLKSPLSEAEHPHKEPKITIYNEKEDISLELLIQIQGIGIPFFHLHPFARINKFILSISYVLKIRTKSTYSNEII